MGLFSKKSTCIICGNKISSILPWKIEGKYVCNECHGIIDMQVGRDDNLTLHEFQRYRDFREENELRKKTFHVSQIICVGDNVIVFDYEHHQFCMSQNLDKTIFDGNVIKYFTIKEDTSLLYEGCVETIFRYESKIPERINALLLQQKEHEQSISQQNNTHKMKHVNLDNTSITDTNTSFTEFFKYFNIALHLNHPYWEVIEFEMKGPTITISKPDIYGYLEDYQLQIQKLEVFVQAIKKIAFPNAKENIVKVSEKNEGKVTTNNTSEDIINEIKHYKELMDEGIITEEEFVLKKKQLMDIM